MLKILAIIISKLQGCGLFFSSLNFFSCLYHEPIDFYNQKKKVLLLSFIYIYNTNSHCSQFHIGEGPI